MFPFMNAQNMTQPFGPMLALGPMREHQEKWLKLFNSWNALLASSGDLGGDWATFAQESCVQTPDYWSRLASSPSPMTFMTSVAEYCKFLDRCWEKVLRSEHYAQSSANFLVKFLEFSQAFQECTQLCISWLPIPTMQQVEELNRKIQALTAQVAALQKEARSTPC